MQETGQKNSIPLSDEALALRFQNGDDAAFSELAARYLKVIRIKACSFREIFSLEREDLYQEGLLGLLDAANSYKPSERTSFETYAGRCINNRIVSAVRRSSSLKNSFLNNAVPIEEMEDLGADRLSDPQTLLESRDEMDRLLSVIHISLSILSCACFLCILAAISGRKQRENSAFRRVRSITRWRVYAKSCGRKTMTPKDDFRADTFSIYLYVYALPQLMALFFNEAVQIRRGQNSFYSIMTKAR